MYSKITNKQLLFVAFRNFRNMFEIWKFLAAKKKKREKRNYLKK